MRSLYRIFDRYLPRDNYNQEPILYLTNGTYVIYAYSPPILIKETLGICLYLKYFKWPGK